jgi:hypothetical protein
MSRSRSDAGAALGLALAVVTVSACGSDTTVASCRYDHRPPLPQDIRQPEAVILERAKRILRRTATTDRRSGLAQVLAGSGYRIEQIGTWGVNDKPGRGRPFTIIGAAIDVAIDRPHRVDAVVMAAGDAWPPRSDKNRYSRRYGYVEQRVHMVSPSLTGLSILVDVRRRQVAEVGQAPDTDVSRYDRLPGECPAHPLPPD